MKYICTKEEIWNIDIKFKAWDLIFLYWDLGSWKTTLVSALINKILNKDIKIQSPTYIHYKKYDKIFHFDLYRLESYNDFVNIWWEEILDNESLISFIEWPEILEDNYKPAYIIRLEKLPQDLNKRSIVIEKLL